MLSLVLAFDSRVWGAWLVLFFGLLLWYKPYLGEGVMLAMANVSMGIVAPLLWDHMEPYQQARLKVFIDYQNAFHGARSAFGLHHQRHTAGQINPLRLAQHVVDAGLVVDRHRELVEVRVYRGEPSSKFSPIGQAACQRQVAYWDTLPLVTPIVRPLKYYPDGTVREKGIDVLIALDIAEGAYDDRYDVAILMSADSDLIPALERAITHDKRIEVAAWTGPTVRIRLRVPGRSVWCHALDARSYADVHDPADYARPM